MQYGVDVSSFQGPPGSWSAEAGSVGWAAVKFTELAPGSSYTNMTAAEDWTYLKRMGMGRIGYLFGHPGTSVAATVGLFDAACARFGLDDGDGICLDLEIAGTLDTAAAVAQWAADVLALLRARHGRVPLLYTFLSFAWAGNCAGLGKYPLWIADPSTSAGNPRVPAPWATWLIHQYVITGPIDRDVAQWGSRAGMTAAVGRIPDRPPAPTPTGKDAMQDLGGNLSQAGLSCGRWVPGGEIVVAGTDAAGQVMTKRWDGKAWSPWKALTGHKAKGSPTVTAFGEGTRKDGRLYYTSAANGHVIELTTGDGGLTWT